MKVTEGWWHFGNLGGFCAGDRGFDRLRVGKLGGVEDCRAPFIFDGVLVIWTVD